MGRGGCLGEAGMTYLRSAIWFMASVALGGASAGLLAYLILLAIAPASVMNFAHLLQAPIVFGGVAGGALALLRIFGQK